VKLLDFSKKEHKAAEYLAVNPMGKVPAIVHRGVVVTETAAIIAYLADTFPQAGLAPAPGEPARGAYYRWLFFGAGSFEPAQLDKMMNRPEVERKAAVGWGSYDDVLATLKAALATGPYLLGEKFTAADLYIGSELNFAVMFGAPGLKGEPVIDTYLARLTTRPAFQRAMAG
jgi:glutathione S-transferase